MFLRFGQIFCFLWHFKAPIERTLATVFELEDLTVPHDPLQEQKVEHLYHTHEEHLNLSDSASPARLELHVFELSIVQYLLNHLRVLLVSQDQGVSEPGDTKQEADE